MHYLLTIITTFLAIVQVDLSWSGADYAKYTHHGKSSLLPNVLTKRELRKHKKTMEICLELLVAISVLCCIVNGQQFEGDPCTDQRTNRPGICKVLSQCQSAIEAVKKRIFPTTCGFHGSNIIVCCLSSEPVKKDRNPGDKANEMCTEYAQYVWKREPSPTLLVGAEDILTKECPFDKLELVVGGEPAERREFPHMAQIGFGENPTFWECGGTLISDQYVLTAAHCIEDRSRGPALYVRMGFTDIDDPEHLQQFNVVERMAHPNYSALSNYHDIGLLKLNQKAQLNTWVRPACLYTNQMSPWIKVIASGWGRTEFGGSESPVLLRVILELYNDTFCNKVYKRESTTSRLQEGIKDESMICAGHSQDLKDTCQGDSGGPLQVYKDNRGNSNLSCVYDIIGVTSFGKACGLAVNIPGVYTRVSYYLKWIEDTVWPTSQ